MRDSYNSRPSFPALTWLICVIAAGYVIENIFIRWLGLSEQFFNLTALSVEGIKKGFVWTLVSSSLIHDPQNLLHLGFTLLSLYVFGRIVAEMIGARRMIVAFIVGLVFGGLGWLLVNFVHPGLAGFHFGAAAGTSALIVLLAFLDPHQPMTLWTLDVGLTTKRLAIVLLVVNVLGLTLLEIPGHESWLSMSHSAHLGGMFAGWLFYALVMKRGWFSNWFSFGSGASVQLPAWFRKSRKKSTAIPTSYKVNISSPQVENTDTMKAEIDRILDKINSDGFQSLTAEEKRRLDAARNHLSRR